MIEENKGKGFEEVGKGLIAFANIFTALSVINIYFKDDHINFLAIIISIYTFVMLYYTGYELIQRSTKWLII